MAGGLVYPKLFDPMLSELRQDFSVLHVGSERPIPEIVDVWDAVQRCVYFILDL
jgi:hypothetical protein